MPFHRLQERLLFASVWVKEVLVEGYRRVVTGADAQGGSRIVADEQVRPTAFQQTPGFRTTFLAATPPAISANANAARPNVAEGPIVPAAGGASFVIIDFPPDAVMSESDFDPAAAGQEMLDLLPGFAELFDPEAPGMHRTPSIDYAVLLAGELWLELGDGSLTRLSAGDSVVQNGTRHAWRNRSVTTATLAVVLTGASEITWSTS
ncbi:MAG: hypothetical protein DI637_01820 [Citromicrobium sp.]|nr:MAG: hypothetical protein DI637_01820 [Citromicrobium sp.]